MTVFGLPTAMDPAAALLDELHRSVGHVLWLAEKVAGLAASIDDAGREAPLIVRTAANVHTS